MARRKIWIEPVTDRTKADTNYIKSLANTIREYGIESLSEEQRHFWFFGSEEKLSTSDDLLGTAGGTQLMCCTKIIKGTMNAHDYNRIENNCVILAELLNRNGYAVNITVKADWIMTDFPYLSEVNRIRDNVNALLDAFARKAGSPKIHYWDSLNWADANALEKNIKNIDILLQEMISGFRYSGTFYSGQEVALP